MSNLFPIAVLNLQRWFSARIVAGKLIDARCRSSSAAASSELKAALGAKSDPATEIPKSKPTRDGTPPLRTTNLFIKSKMR